MGDAAGGCCCFLTPCSRAASVEWDDRWNNGICNLLSWRVAWLGLQNHVFTGFGPHDICRSNNTPTPFVKWTHPNKRASQLLTTAGPHFRLHWQLGSDGVPHAFVTLIGSSDQSFVIPGGVSTTVAHAHRLLLAVGGINDWTHCLDRLMVVW